MFKFEVSVPGCVWGLNILMGPFIKGLSQDRPRPDAAVLAALHKGTFRSLHVFTLLPTQKNPVV